MSKRDDLMQRRATLSSTKRALLEKWSQGGSSRPGAIPRRPADTQPPLSFAQQRLWVIDQLIPNSPAYNISTSVRLSGWLRVDALQQSLDALVARHESLRTTFPISDGRPIQLIAPTLTITLPLIDLRDEPVSTREATALQHASAEVRRAFDLARGPLLRATLLRLDDDQHMLVLIVHHIVSDGWSVGIMVRELATLYSGFADGRPASLPALPIQYADFAVWQRASLQGEALEQQLSFWRTHLDGAPLVLELPTDHPRPAIQSFRGAAAGFRLAPALAEALHALCRREEVTLFMTFLAAYQTLMYRYSRQSDILVGTPIANRTRMETEGLIGFFANTLVVRTQLSDTLTFHELVQRVRESTLEAHAHQDLPFEKLVDVLQPARDMSRNPLFQIMFVLQNTPSSTITTPGLTLEVVPVKSETSKFDLWLSMEEYGDSIIGIMECNTDLFDPSTMRRIMRHFQRLLDSIVANPDQRLAALPFLTGAEQQQLLCEWNDTTVGVRSQGSGVRSRIADACIHELFEAQAARTPDAVALFFDRGQGSGVRDQESPAFSLQPPRGYPAFSLQLTYAELNARANQLARHLQTLGVGPDVRVGISLERSLDLVIGLFGILKAGGAYVPIDPALPPDRLAIMLADSQAPLLITNSIYDLRLTIDDLEASQSPIVNRKSKIVNLHADWSTIARSPTTNPTSAVMLDNLGYVIYTSGSTGVPKGVAMSHRALVNLLAWQLPYLGHQIGTRFLQFASLSFDVSYQEIFPTLASGGTVALISEELRRDVRNLWLFLDRAAIDRVYLPYVALRQLAEAADLHAAVPRHLHQVTVSGEQLQITGPIIRMFQALDGSALNNFYGPSESHAVTAYALRGDPAAWPTLAPIGRPIANTQMYVVDRHMRPTPIGIPGELLIGGTCLARGYLNRPDLTAERFVPNPFAALTPAAAAAPPLPRTGEGAGGEGLRLYKTGDLARYLADGNLEFLGRIDQQVKLRGYRVELEEIESVLTQHPAVRECVVLARADVSPTSGYADKRLVAYVVPVEGSVEGDTETRRHGDTETEAPVELLTPNPRSLIPELRAFLAKRLPEYMVPSLFMLLKALPLTINRKIDRNALPAPDATRPDLAKEFVAPRSAIERSLAAIWSRIIGIKQIGIYDNFFELGGDSIRSIQIVIQANQAGLRLSPKLLFQHQTIIELAAIIELDQASQADHGATSGPLPLTPIQHWFFEQRDPAPQRWSQVALLEAPTLNPMQLATATRQLLTHHDALRLRFEQTADGPRANIDALSTPPFRWLDLSALPAAQQHRAEQQAISGMQAELELERSPLVRVALLDHGSGQPSRVALVIHQLVADQTAWRIVLADLTSAYAQLDRGEPIALPATTSFKRWAERLLDYAQSDGARQELDYWRESLSMPSPRLPLAAPTTNRATTRTVSRALGVAETHALLTDVPRAYHTKTADVLLTALAQTFAAWTGASALLIDLEQRGGAQSFDTLDFARTVGWLSYRYPVRLNLAEVAGPSAALKAIKEQLRAAPNQGIGYSALRYLADDTIGMQLRSLPQAEVSFTYAGDDAAWSPEAGPLSLATMIAPTDQLGARAYALAITARIVNERLQLDLTYDRTAQQDATIMELAERSIAALRSLIAHCQSPDAGGYTPSDFPLAGLTQSQLDRLLATHAPIADIYPLGPFQAHMLEQRLQHPESGLYLASGVYEVPFAVDVANFARAWQQVIDRHPVLRTSFTWESLDQSLQLVHEHARLTIAQEDLRALTPTEQQARVAEYFQAVRRTSFALTSAPHTDVALFRVGDERYRFVWTFDYMLQDGWGFLLIRDFLACYQAACSGQAAQLDQPRPYRDYIAWTRQQDMAAAEAFWRAMLSGFTTPTPLTACAPGNAPSDGPYMAQNILLPATLTAAVQELARQHQLTPYTLLQAAWALLLSSYTGAQDVVYGVVVSGRPPELAGVDQMVGLFNNLLPMRLRIDPAQPLLPWLKAIQDQLTDLRQYEYSPPLKVKQWSDVPADQPLFESYMVYENLPISEAVVEYAGSKQIRAGDSLSQTEHPLRFVIFPGPQIMLNMSFYPRHFDPPTIARILADFQATLENIVESLGALNR